MGVAVGDINMIQSQILLLLIGLEILLGSDGEGGWYDYIIRNMIAQQDDHVAWGTKF